MTQPPQLSFVVACLAIGMGCQSEPATSVEGAAGAGAPQGMGLVFVGNSQNTIVFYGMRIDGFTPACL